MASLIKQCGTCVHHSTNGCCHRFPPVVIVVRGQLDAKHPRTEDTDHCGEWTKP